MWPSALYFCLAPPCCDGLFPLLLEVSLNPSLPLTLLRVSHSCDKSDKYTYADSKHGLQVEPEAACRAEDAWYVVKPCCGCTSCFRTAKKTSHGICWRIVRWVLACGRADITSASYFSHKKGKVDISPFNLGLNDPSLDRKSLYLYREPLPPMWIPFAFILLSDWSLAISLSENSMKVKGPFPRKDTSRYRI